MLCDLGKSLPLSGLYSSDLSKERLHLMFSSRQKSLLHDICRSWVRSRRLSIDGLLEACSAVELRLQDGSSGPFTFGERRKWTSQADSCARCLLVPSAVFRGWSLSPAPRGLPSQVPDRGHSPAQKPPHPEQGFPYFQATPENNPVSCESPESSSQ